jgi:mannosyl-oligosaccharide alpha-1,2-mannosidase
MLRGGKPHPSYYTPQTPPVPFRPHKPLDPSPTSFRADQVRQAFLHAYSGYQKQALPYDELLPVDGGKVNK